MTVSTKLLGMQQSQRALRNALAKIQSDQFLTVGIHEGAPSVEGGSITMAQLGAVQHFGSSDGHIPARPWLDVGVATGNDKYIGIIKYHLSVNHDIPRILERLGAVAVGKVQDYITDLRDPPNAKSTIQAKKSDNPLIDTGAMRQSVTFAIQTGRPEEGIG